MRAAGEFDALAAGIPPAHVARCAALAAAVHDVTALLLAGAAEAAEASVEGGARQATDDLLTMWANELECANRNALSRRTARGYHALLKALVALLEGHAKTLCWGFAHLPQPLTVAAVVAYGAHHLRMWDKALDAACAAARVARRTPAAGVYRACRCAAGMEPPAAPKRAAPDDGFDSDAVDLNDSDDDWEAEDGRVQ